MIHHARLIWRILRHKAFLVRSGRWFGVTWRRILRHDLTKLTRCERQGYLVQFFIPETSRTLCETALWLDARGHHLRVNDHHWEYWVTDGVARTMHPDAIREMVADWCAACRAKEGVWPFELRHDLRWPWLDRNWERMNLDPLTRVIARALLANINIEPPISDMELEYMEAQFQAGEPDGVRRLG